MILFKCKNCGGDLEIIPNNKKSIAQCIYCGSMMTLPKEIDEKKVNLFNRANHYRISKEFDKALDMYNTILNEYPEEAEVYWGIILSKYGIEYVDDPKTKKKIPTCHRAMLKSIYNDEDYKKVIELSDSDSKKVYEENAKAIEEIQKRILKISSQEKPFDVFICYKETDDIKNDRTEDSVRAQNLYDKLVGAKLRVFFARITLEDKLGEDYEPYIFAALNSAKVMIVVGSSIDYFNAIWVKNEWSRYLDIIKKDSNKLLIPAYYKMNPYDIPVELASLQAQNMEKMGFEQELIRVIKKNVKNDKTKDYEKSNENLNNDRGYENLLNRAYIFLSEGEFQKADEYFERVLDINAEECSAYWGKTLTHVKACKSEELDEKIHYNNIFLITKRYFSKAYQVTEEIIDRSILIYLGKSYSNAVKYANEEDSNLYKSYFNILKEKTSEIISIKAKEEKEEEERIRQEQERIRQEKKEEEERVRQEEERIRQEEELQLKAENEAIKKEKRYKIINISTQILLFAILILLTETMGILEGDKASIWVAKISVLYIILAIIRGILKGIFTENIGIKSSILFVILYSIYLPLSYSWKMGINIIIHLFYAPFRAIEIAILIMIREFFAAIIPCTVIWIIKWVVRRIKNY